MYSFLDRLINLALPRTRDFQGVSPSSFDGNGNFSIGVKDQGVFPEIRLVLIDLLSKQNYSCPLVHGAQAWLFDLVWSLVTTKLHVGYYI